MFQEISKNFAEGGASIKIFQVCFVDTLCCDVLRCFLLFVVASRRHIPFVFHFGASVVGGNRHRIMLQLLPAEKSQWTWQLSPFKGYPTNGFQTPRRNLPIKGRSTKLLLDYKVYLKPPIGSMYGICTYIYHKNQPNVGKYTIHGSYGP